MHKEYGLVFGETVTVVGKDSQGGEETGKAVGVDKGGEGGEGGEEERKTPGTEAS